MSKLFTASVVVLIVVLMFALYCDRQPAGTISVSQSFLDSLTAIANTPATIEYKDTIIIKDTIIYKYREKLVPVYIDTNNVKMYSDSVVNNDIDVKVDLKVNGELLSIDWRYKPITKEVTKEITTIKPYPVRYEVPTPQSGIYVGAGVGCGSSDFIISLKTGYLNKSGLMYEIEAGNFKNNYLKVGFGKMF